MFVACYVSDDANDGVSNSVKNGFSNDDNIGVNNGVSNDVNNTCDVKLNNPEKHKIKRNKKTIDAGPITGGM